MSSLQLLVVVLLGVWPGIVTAGVVRQFLAVHFQRQSGLVYHSGLLVSATVRSRGECLQRCGASPKCSAFTFTPGQGHGGSCRGHHVQSMADDDATTVTVSPSTMAYALPSRFDFGLLQGQPGTTKQGQGTTPFSTSPPPGLYSRCEESSGCPGFMSDASWTCLSSQCLCDLGFYYRVSTKACVQVCEPAENLEDEFVQYENYQLVDGEVQSLVEEYWPEAECDAWCLNNAECHAVNFVHENNSCMGLGEPPQPLNASSFKPSPLSVFKMRKCT